MAESAKRPRDVSNKMAGPGPLSIEQAVRAAVGSRVQVRTINPHNQTLEGILYTACVQTNLLAITTGTASSPTCHILPISALASFNILSLPSGPQQALAPRPVNTTALLSRANAAVARAKERANKVNKGVDRATQDLFDALDKQYKSRWQNRDIVVMDSVLVKSPGYRSEDCLVITRDGEGLLGRVRLILENEKRRAAQRDGGKAVRAAVPNIVPAVPAPQGPRKGG